MTFSIRLGQMYWKQCHLGKTYETVLFQFFPGIWVQLRQYQSTDNQVGTCASPPLLKQSPSVSKCNVPTGSCEKPFGNTTRGNTKDPTKKSHRSPFIPTSYQYIDYFMPVMYSAYKYISWNYLTYLLPCISMLHYVGFAHLHT